MNGFKEMDPEVALQAIEGYKDALTKEAEELERMYASRKCPRCKTDLVKEFDARHTFADPTYMNGRALLRCGNCRYLLDPFSNIVLEYGDPSKIPDPPGPPLIRG